MVPEDRKRHGLVPMMNARENISLPTLERFARRGWVRPAAERRNAQTYFDRLRIRAPSTEAIVAGLSGGNQQKVVLGKWLAADCRVLIVDEPTRGVDVGAKAEIHSLIDELAHKGNGVLLISSELPEVINLSTRILVLRKGRIVSDVPRAQATQETLVRLMAGIAA
jgi:ABC-type sugar transport system ATPase subunit